MELTQDMLKEYLEYSDGQLFKKISSGSSKKGKRFGTLRKDGYRCGSLLGHWDLEHRFVYLFHYGYIPEFIDHVNGDKSDNRIENLRPATRSENAKNKKRHSNNKSGHPNVTKRTNRNLWRVQLKDKGTTIIDKSFSDFELACLVADEARALYYKEFARHG